MTTIKLYNGYYIEKSLNNATLKQSYIGMRKGVQTMCSKIISHHRDVEDALKAYVERSQNCGEDKEVSISEYIEEIKKCNNMTLENLTGFLTEVETPDARPDEDFGIVCLIPFGKENAISRSDLVNECISAGLINDSKCADRAMRALLEKARYDFAILNNQDGKGYYRPTKADYEELRKHLAREQKRARTLFASLKTESALLEDFRVGRV